MIGEVSNHLWQSTVFAILAGLLTLAFRKNRAQVRYWLWFSASLKFLIPFSILLTLGGYLGRSRPASRVAITPITYAVVQIADPFPATPAPTPMAQSHGDWIPIALISLWACGLVAIGLMHLRGWLRIRAAVRASLPLDIPFPVEVRSSPALLEPGVVGFFQPILLCPRGIVERLTPSQLQAVLAHELCHIRRRDNLSAAVHMIVEAVFWFHPLVWWISARLMEERERACDEAVLELGSEPQVYAESILETCKLCVESPLACASGVTGADLKKRIVRIMTQGLAGKLSFGGKVLLASIGIAAVALPVVFGLINGPQTRAQATQTTSAPLPSFEVASIKPNRSGENRTNIMFPSGRFATTNAGIKRLIAFAYNVRDFQVSGGPSWADSEKYDIDAKVEDSLAGSLEKLPIEQQADQIRLMVQSLLADRFKLRVSHTTKVLPVYALVIAKRGPKLKEAKPGDTYPNGIKGPDGVARPGMMRMIGRSDLTGQGVSMEILARQLAFLLGLTVLDQTGLKGNYDFALQWTPEQKTAVMFKGAEDGNPGPANAPPVDSSGPSLFTAIQEQLGLKLESTKGPVDIIVIDHIERPSEN
jgi:uncharacterized protein (TIGR03435 family)